MNQKAIRQPRMAGIWGKIIGGGLGFLAGGGPLGAVVGMAIGHAYDTRRDSFIQAPWQSTQGKPNATDEQTRQSVYTTSVVVLSAKLAKVDGRVTRDEIDAFKRVFQIKSDQEVAIGQVFDQAHRRGDSFEPYAFRLAQAYNSQPAMLENVLAGLFTIAMADSKDSSITVNEVRFLKQIAYTFNIRPEDFYRIASRAGARMPDGEQTKEQDRQTSDDPFAILGINAKASNGDIKASYRKLIRKYHPDKFTAAGKSAETISKATEQMKRLNAAYETVCKMRGIK
jgi:DnaJ like chaperone protein